MIRAAEGRDMGALVDMGRAFFVEARHERTHPAFTFDADDFAASLALLAKHGLLRVAERGGGPVAMGAIDVSTAYWNRKVVLSRECFWYVSPDHRKGLGRRLLTDMETASRDYGAVVFDVVAEPGPRSAALEKIYERAGFNPAEHTFRKILRP